MSRRIKTTKWYQVEIWLAAENRWEPILARFVHLKEARRERDAFRQAGQLARVIQYAKREVP